jgi:hypothetical protein
MHQLKTRKREVEELIRSNQELKTKLEQAEQRATQEEEEKNTAQGKELELNDIITQLQEQLQQEKEVYDKVRAESLLRWGP